MSQSLYTSMGGISAAQTDLNVISNNIANINTVAFKSSSTNFSEVYSSTMSSGTAATSTTGGTNPMQVGLGVQVDSISKNFSSGTWVATGKTTDLMIQGDGFFTAEDSGGTKYYTRAGDFSVDSDGDLVTSGGYKVLGTDKLLSTTASTTAVHIPLQIDSTVEPTQTADFTGEKLTDLNNCTLSAGSFYVNVGDSTGSATTDIKVTITDADLKGTVTDLVTKLNTALSGSGATASAVDGKLVFSLGTKSGSVTATSITFKNPTTAQLNADSTLTASNFVDKTGLGSATYDSTAKTLTSKAMDENVVIAQVTSADTEGYAKETSYSIRTDGSIEVTYSNGDKLGVQLSDDGNSYEFLYTTAENVKISGDKVNMDKNVATESNLVLQLASVTNSDGLISSGSNLFTAGPNTGDIAYSVGNEMGLGSIASGGYEASNVDLSSEFSAMILAQRAVQANSRVFTTTSNIMDTITQMGR